MAATLSFGRRMVPLLPKRPQKSLGNKLQEIAFRSPKDLAALEVLADLVLERLDRHAQAKAHLPHR